MITQKSPLWLAYSEFRAPSVWLERQSWVGRGSGLFIVQISSWWSVIWTVCLAFIFMLQWTCYWAVVQTLALPCSETLTTLILKKKNLLQQATEENTGNTMERVDIPPWVFWDSAPRDTFGEFLVLCRLNKNPKVHLLWPPVELKNDFKALH